tara:strand:- start:547 stop:1275 length:729 start_codon:yes stop_codon:yes gene_type:complete
MKKFILLLIVSLLFFTCAPEYYTPQSMFQSGDNPNENRKEGNYKHEKRSLKDENLYTPQSLKKDIIVEKIIDDYFPQTQRKDLVLPEINTDFIGTWIADDPKKIGNKIIINLLENNNGTSSEITNGKKSIPLTFFWFHAKNKIIYFPDLTSYSYDYSDWNWDEWSKDYSLKYEFVSTQKLKLFTDEGTLIFHKQDNLKTNSFISNYLPQTMVKNYEYTPQTTYELNYKSKSITDPYAPQTTK